MSLQAQAIMLLAGTGSGWSSSNYTSFLGSAGANPGRPFPTPGDLNHPMSRAGSPAPPHQSAGPALTKSPNRQVTTAGLIATLLGQHPFPQCRRSKILEAQCCTPVLMYLTFVYCS
jgi:hypothetical protein